MTFAITLFVVMNPTLVKSAGAEFGRIIQVRCDPFILAGAALLLSVAAGLACFVPARRVASADPMEAMRYQ